MTASPEMWAGRRLVDDATLRLAAAGVPSPRYDAAELLAHVLGVRRAEAWLREVSAEQRAAFEVLVDRRAAREPLQHLTGTAAFRHLELKVGPGVFVPRPETEVLAGWVVDHAKTLEHPVVVDLCTGSGAVALSVAHEVPTARVHAVEVDEDAFGWACLNAVGSGVDLRHGDMAEAFHDLDGTADLVVSNPPYIPLSAYDSVEVEVRDHDPGRALWARDADGLDSIRVVERVAARLLGPGGVVAVEHADVQGGPAVAVFSGTRRWREVGDHLDLAGRPRFVTARLAR